MWPFDSDPTPMLRPTKVRQYLSMMRTRGFSSEQVLAGSGISEKQLLDPTTLLDLEQCHKVMSNLIELTGNHCIGFEFGRECQITDLGIVGYAMASSSTLGQSVNLFFGYANSSSGLPVHIEVFENTDGSWGMTATATAAISDPLFKFYFEEIIGMGLSLEPMLTGETFVIREVRFASSPQHYDASLEKMLGCPVIFNSKKNAVTISSPRLDIPLRGNDDRVNDLCLLHCHHIMRQVGRAGTTASQVRSLLLKSRSALSLDDAAAKLHTSSRTLRRRLANEGTSFQGLLDDFRSDLAKEYLETGLIPSKEIAQRLGFGRVDAFRRAFKTWNGTTIRNYKKTGDTARG